MIEREASHNQRINEIDIAKGIGILLVVIGHRTLAMDMDVATAIISSFHMPLFFMLSGLVMKADSEFSLIGSIKSERKLLSNYIFWSGIYILFDIIVRMIILGENNLVSLFLDCYVTGTLFGISVLWFIATLFISKVLAKWVISKISSGGLQFIVGTICFIVVAAVTWVYVGSLGEIHGITRAIYYPTLMILRSLAMAGFVLCGYAMRNVVRNVLEAKWGGYLVLALLANLLIAGRFGTYGYRSMELNNPLLAYTLAMTGTAGVLGLSMWIARAGILNKAFTYFGRHSLFIMVTHEHLMLGAWTAAAIALAFPKELSVLYLIIQIVILMIVEVLLCWLIAPWCVKATGWMENTMIRRDT